jgi:hypothetical protein
LYKVAAARNESFDDLWGGEGDKGQRHHHHHQQIEEEEGFTVSTAMRVKKPFEEVMYFAGVDKGRVSRLKVNDDEFLKWDEIGNRSVVMVNEQADVHAAANSTVLRRMSSSPPRNRPKTPEQQQNVSATRNNKITLMNLRSPLAVSDWGSGGGAPPSDFLMVNAESDAHDESAAAAAAAKAEAASTDEFLCNFDESAIASMEAPRSHAAQSSSSSSASATAVSPASSSPTSSKPLPLGSMRALTITLPSPADAGTAVVSGALLAANTHTQPLQHACVAFRISRIIRQ